MENKSHWIFDYIKQSYKEGSNVPHNFLPKPETEGLKKVEPKRHAGSIKDKKHVTFSQNKSYISEVMSYEEPKLIKNKKFNESAAVNISDKNDIEKYIEEEFNTIDQNLEELRILSEKATRENTLDENDEIREAVLAEIVAIEKRANEIRVTLQKNY
jgi:hypothetical protein